MTVSFDELISRVLQDEAKEVCTPEIRDNMWKNISADLRLIEDTASGQKQSDTVKD